MSNEHSVTKHTIRHVVTRTFCSLVCTQPGNIFEWRPVSCGNVLWGNDFCLPRDVWLVGLCPWSNQCYMLKWNTATLKMLNRIEVVWINLHQDMTKNPSVKIDPYDITISLRLLPHPLPQLQQPYIHEISMPDLWVKVIFFCKEKPIKRI